jgi:prepilin-type N-terminal cleavage/methylation domain-containing protein
MTASLNRGFTFIEILVAATIMALTIGTSVAGYSQFNKRQKVKQGALTFKNNLRYVQTRALSAQRPEDYPSCDILNGYQVAWVSLTTYTFRAMCANGNGPITTYSLPTNVEFVGSFSFVFLSYQTSSSRVSGPATVQIRQTGTVSPTYKVQVSSSGDIIDGGYN